jgi:hypothetical protein
MTSATTLMILTGAAAVLVGATIIFAAMASANPCSGSNCAGYNLANQSVDTRSPTEQFQISNPEQQKRLAARRIS